jgi:hypothetical protein
MVRIFLFYLRSVCLTRDSGDIQSTEALGYDGTIGTDG